MNIQSLNASFNSFFHAIGPIILIAILPSIVFCQDTLNYKDSSHFLYPIQLKYVGSTTEIDGNYKHIMEDLVTFINDHEEFKIHIRGHVCCGPNPRISKLRAKKVYNYLVLNGIPEERLTFKGYSDTMPAVWPEKTDAEEAENRRVDIVFCR